MADLVTNKTLNVSPTKATQYITIASDGTNQSLAVVYDSSAVAALQGDTDSLTCTIEKVYCSISGPTSVRANLYFDGTTDVLAMDFPPLATPVQADFTSFGGLKNTAGAGRTGDILLTTTGLSSTSTMTLILIVRRN